VTSRPRTRTVVAALAAVGALALSGCDVHPGTAAVVNDQSISEGHVDDLVLAACDFSKVQRLQTGGTEPSTSMAYLRNVLLQNLISFKITHEAATNRHLTVSEAKIAEASQGQSIPAGVSADDRDLLNQFFVDSARWELEQAVIGANLKDPSVTNADNVTSSNVQGFVQRAQAFLTRFTENQHVVVNPAYGSWNGQTLEDSNGSLSAPASSSALKLVQLRLAASSSVEGLPPSQVCG
jgi:hypothetical protein